MLDLAILESADPILYSPNIYCSATVVFSRPLKVETGTRVQRVYISSLASSSSLCLRVNRTRTRNGTLLIPCYEVRKTLESCDESHLGPNELVESSVYADILGSHLLLSELLDLTHGARGTLLKGGAVKS